MARTAPKKEMAEFKIPEPGWHLGVCDRIIVMGEQKTEYKGIEKIQPKVYLRWALPEDLMDDGRPMVVGKTYTYSMFEKARLCMDIQTWLGHDFSNQEEADGFDIDQLLGKQANLKIKHKPGDTRTYANIDYVDECKDKEIPPDLIEPFIYDVDDSSTWNHFEDLPNWIKDKIPAPGAVAKQGSAFKDDDIPF